MVPTLPRPHFIPFDPNPLVQLLLPHENRGAGGAGHKEVGEGKGGRARMKKPDPGLWLGLLLAVLTFGVILAVLAQNYMDME